MSAASGEGRRVANTENVLEFIKGSNTPVITAPDLAKEFDISQQAAYDKLRRLHSKGVVDRKKVGARAVVWFLKGDYSVSLKESET